MLKAYYYLAKPGIIYGNAMTTVAGFFIGSTAGFNLGLFITSLLGTCLIMACGCVLNNYIDRGIDQKMARTKKRALVTGSISNANALFYAMALGAVGFALLMTFTNAITVTLGILALFFYVVVYGVSKRRGIYGTFVGTIPGALPPVAGYTAATNHLDLGAALLFMILVFWQLGHFYAIAIFRAKEYAAAGIPLLPIKKGNRITKQVIVASTVLLLASVLLLVAFGYAGIFFGAVTTALIVSWLANQVYSYKRLGDEAWAKRMFLHSLLVLVGLSAAMIIDAIFRQNAYTFYMILVLHIVVALASLGYATYLFFAPTTKKLRFTYILSGITLASGTYLVISQGSHMLEACVTGLLYFSVILFCTISARNKLSAVTVKTES